MDRIGDKEICEVILNALEGGDLPESFDPSFVEKMYSLCQTQKLSERQYVALENIYVGFKLGHYRN